ncbi:MAG: hypothetical protein ACW98J_06815 [Candidatus Thorarchaeota archaeon]|jgi:hypothetical protein
MYVKIRTDGAVGIGRGTDGAAEITLGYGEAHMIAAALTKLAQTARSYKQTYHKTTDVGGGNKIDFERSEEGTISIAGDRQTYVCTEAEIRELAEKLTHLPPVEVAPASDYVKKTKPKQGYCITVMNGGQTISLKLAEAALMKTAVQGSLDSRFFDEKIAIGDRELTVNRSSDLKWQLGDATTVVKFTAYEVEALIAGLHNGILDVIMDMVKALGSDDLADIRVKSQIQRVEQESAKILGEYKKAKSVARNIGKSARRIIGTGEDADARTNRFIELCRYVQSKVDPTYQESLLNLISETFAGK